MKHPLKACSFVDHFYFQGTPAETDLDYVALFHVIRSLCGTAVNGHMVVVAPSFATVRRFIILETFKYYLIASEKKLISIRRR